MFVSNVAGAMVDKVMSTEYVLLYCHRNYFLLQAKSLLSVFLFFAFIPLDSLLQFGNLNRLLGTLSFQLFDLSEDGK